MYTEELRKECNSNVIETLDSYLLKDENYRISNTAKFSGYKHRSKVEFLRFFIV